MTKLGSQFKYFGTPLVGAQGKMLVLCEGGMKPREELIFQEVSVAEIS